MEASSGGVDIRPFQPGETRPDPTIDIPPSEDPTTTKPVESDDSSSSANIVPHLSKV